MRVTNVLVPQFPPLSLLPPRPLLADICFLSDIWMLHCFCLLPVIFLFLSRAATLLSAHLQGTGRHVVQHSFFSLTPTLFLSLSLSFAPKPLVSLTLSLPFSHLTPIFEGSLLSSSSIFSMKQSSYPLFPQNATH